MRFEREAELDPSCDVMRVTIAVKEGEMHYASKSRLIGPKQIS